MKSWRYHPQSLLAVVVFFCFGGLGCGQAEPEVKTRMHRVTFWASSDGKPVSEVRVFFGRQEVGATDGRGMLRLDVPGEDGQRFPIFAQCPSGYRPPDVGETLQLRSFESLNPRTKEFGVEMKIECPPLHRYAVVIVRSGQYGDMPIKRNGREIARTDESGVAHLGFQAQPGERFQFELDTSDHPRLRPQNPKSQLWIMPDENKSFWFDADELFEEPRTRTRNQWIRRPAMAGPMLPTPL